MKYFIFPMSFFFPTFLLETHYPFYLSVRVSAPPVQLSRCRSSTTMDTGLLKDMMHLNHSPLFPIHHLAGKSIPKKEIFNPFLYRSEDPVLAKNRIRRAVPQTKFLKVYHINILDDF